ncbi:MAG: CHAT domain-containing tetratricopeptide repeat protein [Bacteroidales bacterium]|jgi:CHAT domain-containing protein
MVKISRIPVQVIIFLHLILSGNVSANQSGLPVDSDTGKLYQLVLRGQRTTAATFLYKYLSGNKIHSDGELATGWLEFAIFSGWSDTAGFSIAEDAYNTHLKYRVDSKDSSKVHADRLLYQSLLKAANGLYKQAADSLLASIAIRPLVGGLNEILLADSYGKLARFYKETGDLFESARNFRRSISLNKKMGNDRALVLAEDLSDLSSVMSSMDNMEEAESLLNESRSIYVKLDTLQAISQVDNELGVLFVRRLEYQVALKYFIQSLREKKRVPQVRDGEFVVVYNNIGTCYHYLSVEDSARHYFSQAVDYALRSGTNPAEFYGNLGISYGAYADYSTALVYFQQALWYLDPTNIACSKTDLATNPRIKMATPRLAEFTAFKAHTLHRRYNQLHHTEDLINGLKTFSVALEMIDTLRYMYSFESKPYQSKETKIHYFNALDMALDLYHITREQQYLDSAFRYSERNKSAILNEFLRTNQAKEQLETYAPWIRQEDSIKQLINTKESSKIKASSGLKANHAIVSLWQDSIDQLTDELRSLVIDAQKEHPGYFSSVYSNKGYLPNEIQRLILPGEAMLDYTVVQNTRLEEDYMIVIVLTRDTIFSYNDTLPKDFRTDIDAFRSTITSFVDARNFQEFCRLSTQMYRYFFEPIEKFTGIDKLIILPDEELGLLPFEIFLSDTIKPKGSDFRKLSYLNRKYQISYISSHEQFYQFRSKSRKTKKLTVYGFAPFISSGINLDTFNLLPLGSSGEEIKYIGSYFKTKTFDNQKAGEQTLKRAFQTNSVISLSTHGIMDLKEPMQSRLLLNPSEPDGILYLFEMMSLKIKSPLVILNACNTGTGKLQVGEGILSMARGFQFAGVPTLITTLWPIDDHSSATVMNMFFRNIRDGMDQREAMMKARNVYIDQANKATAAPYFWAGQVIIGDPGHISIRQRIRPGVIAVWLVLAGLMLTSLWFIYKKVR